MKKFLIAISICISAYSYATEVPTTLTQKSPPRIIRTCCAFGADLKMTAVPFKKYSDVSAVDQLGSHVYLGSPSEGNGIIYTRRGGFIDLGHLRDQADWTAYLFSTILSNEGKELYLNLGNEGGSKQLTLRIPEKLAREDAARLAAKISFDLSVWHEIATFYGASTVPLIPERYSAFSMEDAYSNMTGAILGLQAVLSTEPYEEAMTSLIENLLIDLEAVEAFDETIAAMEMVKEDWWTDAYRLPSKKVLMKRDFDMADCQLPWIIDHPEYSAEPLTVCLETSDTEGIPLDEYYELNIKLNFKFPVKKLFSEAESRQISQKDFGRLIENAAQKSSFKPQKRRKLRFQAETA
ncbi:DUF4056 domain-containing protein [Jiulongibacter sp. NS-SX5]|uniref:DUF4056 domain-containing protein n=1 Tax=Jiulongibacter sp. NS-SX5 TaxID=3463854 RepID=UPI0040583A9D